MKLRNLAFFGVMASILGINGAYAADTATVIASQAYVDAQNALDEKVANKETANYSNVVAADKNSTTKYPTMNTLTTALTTVDVSGAVSNGDNALSLTDVTNKAPSVHAVQGMVSTTDMITANQSGKIETVDEGDDAHVPTTAVVSDVIKKMHAINADATTANTNAVVNIVQENGQVTVTKGTLATTAIEFTNAEKAALASGIDAGGVEQITTNKNAIDDLESAVNGKEDTSNKVNSLTVDTMNGLGGISDPDNKYPTVKVVADVQNSLNTSLANKQDISDSTVDAPATGTSYIAITAGNDVGDNLEALDAKVKENASDIAARTITNIDGNYKLSDGTTTDAQVYSMANANDKFQDKSESKVATNGNYIQAGTNVAANLGLLDTQVKNNTDGVTNNSTAIGTLANLTTTSKTNLVGAINEVAGTAGNAVAKSDPTGGASNAYNIVSYNANGLVQTAKALNNTMHDINNATADATCSETNPCVLSYLGDTKGYRWTAMDLDGLSVDGGSSSN